jgi:hypothetical protein
LLSIPNRTRLTRLRWSKAERRPRDEDSGLEKHQHLQCRFRTMCEECAVKNATVL